MNQTTHGHQHSGGRDRKENRPRSPYWRRMHHHRYFWVGMLLMLVAMVNYVMTEALSWLPRSQPQQPLSRIDGK